MARDLNPSVATRAPPLPRSSSRRRRSRRCSTGVDDRRGLLAQTSPATTATRSRWDAARRSHCASPPMQKTPTPTTSSASRAPTAAEGRIPDRLVAPRWRDRPRHHRRRHLQRRRRRRVGQRKQRRSARAFMQGPPPKRSIVLIWDRRRTGLWGSRRRLRRHRPPHRRAYLRRHDRPTRRRARACPGRKTWPDRARCSWPARACSAPAWTTPWRASRGSSIATQNRRFDNAAESFFIRGPMPRRISTAHPLRRVLYRPARGLPPAVRRCVEDRSGEGGSGGADGHTSCRRSPAIQSAHAWTSRCRRTWWRCWRSRQSIGDQDRGRGKDAAT